ncbi:MAG TPA: hypothetical protein ENJ52_00825 [Aliiroseovarius sp.]|nr:hypothetical protein [Aliiroseovarius sp.]
MNTSYPPDSFSTDAAAIDGFIDLVCGGFENPESISGTVSVDIPEYPEGGFLVHFADKAGIERGKSSANADTTVTIPIATVHRIFREFEFLDWRDPEIIGTIRFAGNLALANHLAKCCLRPSDQTVARFNRTGRLHARKGYRDLSVLEKLHQPTQRQVLEAMDEGRPIIITGLEPEPPCRDWTLTKLVERYADAVVRVRSANQRQTMAEFVAELQEFMARPHDEIIEGFVKPYTEGAALPEEMWPDFGPLFFDREDFIPPQLWLGAVPTHVPTSSLHRDPLTGFLLQVIGRKRLDLYSADQAELLYPMKAYNNYQPCWFKPQKPDYATYPKAKDAKCLSVTLNRGELLVQPAGWFHQVHALDSPNMSVSYFWRY